MSWYEEDKIDTHTFDYSAAEAALDDAGCHDPEEIWDHHSKSGVNDLLGEYGYSADDFMKDK